MVTAPSSSSSFSRRLSRRSAGLAATQAATAAAPSGVTSFSASSSSCFQAAERDGGEEVSEALGTKLEVFQGTQGAKNRCGKWQGGGEQEPTARLGRHATAAGRQAALQACPACGPAHHPQPSPARRPAPPPLASSCGAAPGCASAWHTAATPSSPSEVSFRMRALSCGIVGWGNG